MGLIVYPTNFPPPQTALIKPEDESATKDLFYLLLALFNRSGKGTGGPQIMVGLVATANTVQAPAPLLAADWNVFATVPNGGICLIPQVVPPSDFIVWNFGSNNLAVTPQATQQIDALGVGVAYSLAPNKMQWFRCPSPNQLYSTQLG